MKPETMVAHEHTAQLATEYAAQVQTDFIKGKINVLSCSTTFELGVDVGELGIHDWTWVDELHICRA